MLELRQDVRATTQVNVLPEVVARASLLELDQEELEERIRAEADRNPALDVADRGRAPRATGHGSFGDAEGDLFARLPAATTLGDDLRWQLHAACKGPLRPVAEYIIENLDGRGYLTTSLFDLSDDLGVSEERVAEALGVVQSLEPPGIGARNLAECLKFQVRARTDAPPGLLAFLEHDFAALSGSNNVRALKSLTSATAQRFLQFIRDRLYPYPADLFRPPYPCQGSELPVRTPDVVVSRDRGALVVTVPLSERLVLRVDAEYEGLARTMAARGAGRQAGDVKRLVGEARTFISNLTHRHRVMAQVAAEVLQVQEGYLREGPRGLRPLTKKELAERTGLHESTICRATRGKTLMLPDGEVIPFDVLFEDALPAKVCLAQIVRREDPGRPWTDARLVCELAAHGYHVARRTVSKYRASVGIAPASDRRQRA